MRVLVTGAGGFIGHHLVKRLKAEGHWVSGVDLHPPEFEDSPADEFRLDDLRHPIALPWAMDRVDQVYALAADMGGMGFISANHAQIVRNNALINLHTIEAAHDEGVGRYLFTSSACIYPEDLQDQPDAPPLAEDDSLYRASEDAYGFEKLFGERLCRAYADEHGLDTRVVRFHNVYGPLGTWQGGREKVPAALCRKVAQADDGGDIEVWGDGQQTRSFMYVDDCIEGLVRIMAADHRDPLNLGSDQAVTVDQLAETIIALSGKQLGIRHVDGPQGVRGRNSDNTRLQRVLDWTPSTPLDVGLKTTYRWIEEQVNP